MLELIQPDWPAHSRIRSVSTTRNGGVSKAPYDGLNLGDHVGDLEQAVHSNRRLVAEACNLPRGPAWLEQVHGTDIADAATVTESCQADGAFTDKPGTVCVIMTADCLPVLLCNRSGTKVAAVHAGWRGLLNGVIEQAVDRFNEPVDELLVWLGPAIGSRAFEVGDEVRTEFVQSDEEAITAFENNRPGHWLADIYQLARVRLQKRGIRSIYGGGECTYTDAGRFFSYRRDGVTGRMATLIWIDPENPKNYL